MGERMRRTGRRVALLLAWAAAAYYGFFGGEYGVLEIHALRSERDALRQRVAELSARAGSLEARAERLIRDPFAVERTARERYGFLRDGEILVRFLPTAGSPPSGGG